MNVPESLKLIASVNSTSGSKKQIAKEFKVAQDGLLPKSENYKFESFGNFQPGTHLALSKNMWPISEITHQKL